MLLLFEMQQVGLKRIHFLLEKTECLNRKLHVANFFSLRNNQDLNKFHVLFEEKIILSSLQCLILSVSNIAIKVTCLKIIHCKYIQNLSMRNNQDLSKFHVLYKEKIILSSPQCFNLICFKHWDKSYMLFITYFLF